MLQSALLGGPDGRPPRSSSMTDWQLSTPAPAPLRALLSSLPQPPVQLGPRRDPMVTDVAYRSQDVRPGGLFFCVPGARRDGHDFASDAVRAGAEVLVVERRLDFSVTQVQVRSVRQAMGPISAAFFGHPGERARLVGVTGTNGKTTTTYLLESIFRSAGLRAGIIGTTGVRSDGTPVAFDRTTPEAPDLQRLLRWMVDDGVEAVAMEVSSHGLHQRRVDGSKYRASVFTNLSQDHLDYHGTIAAYFDAKRRLFTPELSVAGAVNADVPEGRRLASEAAIPLVTFGLEEGCDLRATEVEVSASGCAFTVMGRHYRSSLRGTFNVYNCLGAIAAARQVGVEDADIAAGIRALTGVPGRLEPVDAGQPFAVLVDYAHTPDSLDNVLRAARGLTRGRVIVVFGCGGDRDRGKRPLMGEAATRRADLTVITSDNPRSEDPLAIMAEIEPGALRGGGAYRVEPERRSAIRLALGEARRGDVVLIAGKGHETGQEFADRVVPFDDRQVASEELALLEEGSR
jgi:UDP-N-acetylmuramoyl-L-alanyl-D-glutamate--2,6-diaminopimelate ligase